MDSEKPPESAPGQNGSRIGIAILLSVGSFFLLFILGEGVIIPDTVPAAVPIKLTILIGGFLGYFMVCQYLLSRGHQNAKRDWSLILALNLCPLLLVPMTTFGENVRTGLTMLVALGMTVISSYVGALLAVRSTRRRMQPRDERK